MGFYKGTGFEALVKPFCRICRNSIFFVGQFLGMPFNLQKKHPLYDLDPQLVELLLLALIGFHSTTSAED